MTLTNDNGVDREMTAKELAAYKAVNDEAIAQQTADEAAAAAQAAARTSAIAKLAALGLTADEIAAL